MPILNPVYQCEHNVVASAVQPRIKGSDLANIPSTRTALAVVLYRDQKDVYATQNSLNM